MKYASTLFFKVIFHPQLEHLPVPPHKQHVLPSVKAYGEAAGLVTELTKGVADVEAGLAAMHGAANEEAKATVANNLRLETMEAVRAVCDKAEEVVPADLWTIATYQELLFLDSNQGGEAPIYD